MNITAKAAVRKTQLGSAIGEGLGVRIDATIQTGAFITIDGRTVPGAIDVAIASRDEELVKMLLGLDALGSLRLTVTLEAAPATPEEGR